MSLLVLKYFHRGKERVDCFISLLLLQSYFQFHNHTFSSALQPNQKVSEYDRPFQGGASFADHLCYFSLLLLWFHAHLFVDALRSPAGKGLIYWLSFVMSNCDVVTFPLESWARFGA